MVTEAVDFEEVAGHLEPFVAAIEDAILGDGERPQESFAETCGVGARSAGAT